MQATAKKEKSGMAYDTTIHQVSTETPSVKYMLDVKFERFADPRHSPRPGERGFLSVLTRMQFTF